MTYDPQRHVSWHDADQISAVCLTAKMTSPCRARCARFVPRVRVTSRQQRWLFGAVRVSGVRGWGSILRLSIKRVLATRWDFIKLHRNWSWNFYWMPASVRWEVSASLLPHTRQPPLPSPPSHTPVVDMVIVASLDLLCRLGYEGCSHVPTIHNNV